jgi:protein O-GlcNAc transferase
VTSEIDARVRVAQLRDAVATEPESATAHLRLGTALARIGAMSEAEREFRRALELDPDLPGALINLGGVLLGRWDFKGCIEANRRAGELEPDSVLARYNQGLGHLYLGEAEEMAACFEKVLALDPRNPGGHYYMAVARNALGDIEAARWHVAVATELGFTPQPELLKALEKACGGTVPVLEIGDTAREDSRTAQGGTENGNVHSR